MVDLLALGPLELWREGRQYELGSPKERCVLAVLVHAHGDPVSVDALMDRVWDGEPPRTAQDTLQSYLSRLRSRLAKAAGSDEARLERYAPRHYRLRIAPDAVDLLRHRRLRGNAASAAARGRRELAIGLLRTAESLWRGEPLTEFTGAWAGSARARLLEDHRRVREERIRLELELGRHADLIGELHELAAQNPLAQQVVAALMLALYRSGRHDEALALYRTTRARLHEGQGIEPGAELRELHRRILEQDRTLMETAGTPPGAPRAAGARPEAGGAVADSGRDTPAAHGGPSPHTAPPAHAALSAHTASSPPATPSAHAAPSAPAAPLVPSDTPGGEGADRPGQSGGAGRTSGTGEPGSPGEPDRPRETGSPGQPDSPGKTGSPREPDGPRPSPRPRPNPADAPPTNLPRDVRDFTGRAAELRILLDGSGPDAAPPEAPASLPVTVVHGMPGVGKTALVVHAAHRLTEAYPDGQLYVDLRGYGTLPPYDPAQALDLLLRAAGATDERDERDNARDERGTSLDERVARWRAWTARRRVLVVLDNARDAQQVTPLLPGTASCRAFVTSRNRLTGLDGATPLFLEVLSAAEAAALFRRVAGAAGLPAGVPALARTVGACGCHPLALQLLASQFRHRDSWSLDHLTDRLVRAADPLDEFAGDRVASAFSLSYADLGPEAARVLRRVALHPGPDITPHATAALTAPGRPPDEGPGTAAPGQRRALTDRARKLLDHLLDRNLLDEPVTDRYRLHDLTRAFGLRMCARDDSRAERRAALGRLLDCYLTAAHRAAVRAEPHRRVLAPGPHLASPCAPEFGDGDEASAWLSVERGNLLALARTAAAESPEHAVPFPHALATSLRHWGAWDTAAELFEAAVSAARAGRDRSALARSLVEHAGVLTQKDHAKALRRATEALFLFQELDDVHGRADALLQSARAHFAAGRSGACTRVLDTALPLYQRVQDPYGEAEVANMRGVALHVAGHHGQALDQFRRVLRIHESTGFLYGRLRALNNIGEVHRIDGRHEEARAHYERSLRLARHVGGRQELANLLANLGNVCQATGQVEEALGYFRRALASYRAAGDARGESDTLISLGWACVAGLRPAEALGHFSAAERVARGVGSPLDRQSALLGTGAALRLLGRFDAALDAHHEALRLAREVDSPLGAARALDGLARTTLHTQDAPSARGFAEDALTAYEKLGCTGRARDLRLALAQAELPRKATTT
ncbi:tetratricopeptide repeat protein [Streptomyces sp. CC224B]|uniref:AfsR/SARP family transcriptional regulator n=1 Tax=Streptomyces sp. CC224B TaxID=3044571 RepID=UPI0024A8F092|nr:tetratricopeptide repeat protein [Streptomyces sp. CC224B]